MLHEFKKFVLRGNVVDVAVDVIIGRDPRLTEEVGWLMT